MGDESVGDWTDALGAATVAGDEAGDRNGTDGAVTDTPSSSSSQYGIPSADTFGGVFFVPFFTLLPLLLFDTVTTKVVF